MRDPRDDKAGTVQEFGTVEAGGGRLMRVEKQTLNGHLYGRIRMVRETPGGGEREIDKLWFDPSAIGPLCEALEVLRAAVELEGNT